MRRTVLAGFGVTVAVGITACSSGSTKSADPVHNVPATAAIQGASSSSPGDGACQPDVVARICVTADITGSVSLSAKGQTTAPLPPDASPDVTCADAATLSSDGERDLGGNVQSIGGHTLQWDEDLGHFTGPSTYDLTHSGFYVSIDNASYMADQSSASVTVQPDFSVTYKFTDLHGQGGTISGSLSWTCVDPQ